MRESKRYEFSNFTSKIDVFRSKTTKSLIFALTPTFARFRRPVSRPLRLSPRVAESRVKTALNPQSERLPTD
jgi:hypothetical protein